MLPDQEIKAKCAFTQKSSTQLDLHGSSRKGHRSQLDLQQAQQKFEQTLENLVYSFSDKKT